MNQVKNSHPARPVGINPHGSGIRKRERAGGGKWDAVAVNFHDVAGSRGCARFAGEAVPILLHRGDRHECAGFARCHDPDLAESIFYEKGIPHTTCELVVLALKETGPDLPKCLEILMIKESNVDFAYAMLPGHDGKALLAMRVEHYDFATSILNYSGFRLLYEEDLVR